MQDYVTQPIRSHLNLKILNKTFSVLGYTNTEILFNINVRPSGRRNILTWQILANNIFHAVYSKYHNNKTKELK